MKQINTFDEVNTNFVVLSEQDLLDVEGGFVGAAAGAAGGYLGYSATCWW
ncbi:bacteriocin [Streptococcus pluranimalium]